MPSSLYAKHNYLNKNINLIRNVYIREYDIKSAGLNIIYNKKLITKDEYNTLLKMDKLERNVIIGKWLRENKEVNKIMMDEFVRIRKNIFDLNEIEDEDILTIKKDAIFLINKEMKILNFENYEFVLKNEYTDYMNINSREFYYNKYSDKLETKGFSKEAKVLQQGIYFQLIKDILKLEKDKRNIFLKLVEFKDDFLCKQLEKKYYIDIDSCKYPFKIGGLYYYVNDIDRDLLEYVSIESNLLFINRLISILI